MGRYIVRCVFICLPGLLYVRGLIKLAPAETATSSDLEEELNSAVSP